MLREILEVHGGVRLTAIQSGFNAGSVNPSPPARQSFRRDLKIAAQAALTALFSACAAAVLIDFAGGLGDASASKALWV
ncbi:hypothetical protein ACTTAI_10990 [Rhodobacter capsulatus]|uniref:hypothetical protein n=1 Tax=Rhodobacter capsulatus TaxID=1061 RepID=UPI004028A0BB